MYKLTLLLPALFVLSLGYGVADDGAKNDSDKPAAGELEPIKAGPDDPKEEKSKPGPVDKDAPREFTTTESGLRYRILRKGTDEKPRDDQMCIVHYKGWLDDQTIFQSTYRRGYSILLPVKRVSIGWTEGIKLIGKGGMIELDMPPELGYGKKGKKVDDVIIPPNARLHFIIELEDIDEEPKII